MSDGKFALTVASSSSVLNFSFIGYMTKEVPVGAQSTIDVVMSQAETKLDEIVVVGYSTQARKSLTGSVSQVGAASYQKVLQQTRLPVFRVKLPGLPSLISTPTVKDQQ